MVRAKEHKETQALLPWYVNDTLTGADADLVFRHLANCKDCQVTSQIFRSQNSTAARPLSACPATVMSFSRLMIAASPSRIIWWSSTNNTRIKDGPVRPL